MPPPAQHAFERAREAVKPALLRPRRELLGAVVGTGLLLGCQRDLGNEQGRAPATAAASATAVTSTYVATLDPRSALRCEHLRRSVPTELGQELEIIELRPPEAHEKVVLSKTGVIVGFSRDDLLTAARCFEFEQSIDYLEKETGGVPEAPLRDAFQLSFLAAALLDIGRASVRKREETEFRTSIARGPWSALGCAGRCRSVGRVYRLTDGGSSFFLRVTDRTDNDWE